MDSNASAVACVKAFSNINNAFGMFSSIFMISSIYDRETTVQSKFEEENGIEVKLVAELDEGYVKRMLNSKFKGDWTEGLGGYKFEQPEKPNKNLLQ